MNEFAASLAIGFSSGVLSGAFGIGGGIVTTPAIKILLGAPALVAVGTPLPVILPAAITGAVTYARNGVADIRAGVTCGIAGSLTAVLGAWATSLVGGDVVLLATAALILYAAADMALQAFRPRPAPPVPPAPAEEPVALSPANRHNELVVIGAVAGLYSGFLGLGGGFVLVPLLTRWLRFGMKRAIATSLVAVAILSIPGTLTHAYLGHIDWGIALPLALGVIPGAILGARLTLGASERVVRIAFSVLLLVTGVWLAASELPGLLS